MWRGAMLLAFTWVTACGPLSPARPDAGTDAGATGGGVGGGGGSGGGAGGGGTGGGGTGGTAGGGSTGGGTGGGGTGLPDGGVAPFAFGRVALPSSGVASVVGLGALPAETWVLTSTGSLFHATTGAFTDLALFPAQASRGLYVAPDGAVFLAQESTARWCLSQCTVGTSYSSQAVSGTTLTAVCGSSSSNVYFVGATGTRCCWAERT